MFELTMQEFEILRSQIATSRWGGERYLPYVFTEQGVAMLSTVLNSERAIHAQSRSIKFKVAICDLETGAKVMLSMDLANLYGVTTRNLKRQVKRNLKRFPKEFMFKLTNEEWNELVPIWHQFERMRHSYIMPFAFTEHGVAMLSSVLNSERLLRPHCLSAE